jgi:hypothetical protein
MYEIHIGILNTQNWVLSVILKLSHVFVNLIWLNHSL